MWDLRIANPFGRLSIRNIFLWAAATFAAVLAFTILAAPTTHAADAQWVGSAISHNQKQYIKLDNAAAGNKDLAEGSVIYGFIEPSNANSSDARKAYLIYFPPGTDATKATSATYAIFDFTPPNTFTNPTAKAKISLDIQTAASQATTSCDSSHTFSLGWFLCPVINLLASAMDHLFDILASFLSVRPLQTNQENALYRAWSFMRNFANVSFVIGFLVIIYSQITSIGLSNYEIKKMLPRLVIAAVLVNVSYWICAVAVDVSNILGWSIQEIFIAIRNGLVGAESNSWSSDLTFENVAGFVLSGGTAAVATGVGLYAFAAGAGGAIYMLLPMLLTVLVAVLVALLVMAARQAIITILIIVSPLAFVAFLLPNTEKYFTKWRELGMTMLLLFPIFSVIFGGSQLAGMAIIQNADSINLIILGMGVQVAPVVITPLLVKYSGSLLARIGGIVNNPGKGMIDRTRQWSQDKADLHKAKAIGNGKGFLANRARNIYNRGENRKKETQAYQSLSEANWAKTQKASDIKQVGLMADQVKTKGENDAVARYELSKRTNARVQTIELEARASQQRLDRAKTNTDADWAEVQAGSAKRLITPEGLAGDALRSYREQNEAFAKNIQHDTVQEEVAKSRKHMAEHEQQQHYADAMQASAALQAQAGGIAGQLGADSALASAIANKRQAYGKAVVEAHEILKHINMDGQERQTLALTGKVDVIRDGKLIKSFTEDNVYAHEAAIEAQMRGEGTYQEREKIIAESGMGGRLEKFSTTIGTEMANNKLSDQAIFLGGQTINDAKQGLIRGEAGLNSAVVRTIIKGKIKPTHLVQNDVDAIRRIVSVVESNPADLGLSGDDLRIFNQQVAELSESAKKALTNEALSGQVAQNVEPLLRRLRDRQSPPRP